MKKTKRKIKRNQINKGTIVTCQNIGMERKQEVVLIRSDIDKMTEDEIKDLLIRISNENKELRKTYYALNTPVMQIKKRTFSDLLKKFIRTTKDELSYRVIETTAK